MYKFICFWYFYCVVEIKFNTMKKLNISFLQLQIFLLGATMLIFSGCMRSVRISMLKPAPITVPNHVQTLLIVDRTEPSNEAIGIIEGILTGEMPFEVKNAIEQTISSMQNELNASPRYKVIRARERLKGGLFSMTFPDPLQWHQIESLCRSYNADAVLSLEMFSSNFIVTNGKKSIKKTVKGEDGKNKEIEVPGFYAEGLANIRVGFRMYDPKTRNIADQRDFNRTNTWTAEAETLTQALAKLVDKTQATAHVGRLSGVSYAHRIAPMYVTVSRDFYHKPKKNQYMSRGARFAETNNWQQAIDAWRTGINTSDKKSAARMTYNVALAHEVIGELDLAKDWATRAYTMYGLKKARTYARQIDQRVWDEAMVNEQMALPERQNQGQPNQYNPDSNNKQSNKQFNFSPAKGNN